MGGNAREVQLLPARFLRNKALRGAKKAILAVRASMLIAAYHLLRNATECRDLGNECFDHQDKSKSIHRLIKLRIQDLGCDAPLVAHAG
jgi:transposase